MLGWNVANVSTNKGANSTTTSKFSSRSLRYFRVAAPTPPQLARLFHSFTPVSLELPRAPKHNVRQHSAFTTRMKSLGGGGHDQFANTHNRRPLLQPPVTTINAFGDDVQVGHEHKLEANPDLLCQAWVTVRKGSNTCIAGFFGHL